jgi:hypothetical protein
MRLPIGNVSDGSSVTLVCGSVAKRLKSGLNGFVRVQIREVCTGHPHAGGCIRSIGESELVDHDPLADELKRRFE